MKQQVERRSFYRIDDIVDLRYQVLDGDSAGPPHDAMDVNVPVSSLLPEIDRKFHKYTNTLWQENPTVAQALGMLNRKLSILFYQGIGDQQGEERVFEEMTVNISGSGIGFDCSEQHPAGTRLLLSLRLPPSSVELSITGTVCGCDPHSSGAHNSAPSYRIRVRFDDDNEAAREQLIQHVVQRQFAQVKNRGKRR